MNHPFLLGIAYVVGYVSFVVTAICVWAFVYRPKFDGLSFGYGTWNNKDIVKNAMIQGVIWPIMVPLYVAGLLLVGIWWTLISGVDRLANRVASALPQGEDRYSGFRRKLSDRERDW